MKNGTLITYWVFTALFCVGMSASGIQQIIKTQQMVDIMTHLGYPGYLMQILGVWKLLGVIAILVPGFRILKEWAYAGFFFVMTGALISHLVMGDTGKAILGPLMQTIFIMMSWYFRPANRKVSAT